MISSGAGNCAGPFFVYCARMCARMSARETKSSALYRTPCVSSARR